MISDRRSISNRVAQWSFGGQRTLVAEKIWTKEEWKTYKKEHPDTTVKPKFTEERTKGKKDDPKEKGKKDDKSKAKKDIEDKVKDKKTDDTDKIIEDEVNKKVKEKSKKKGVDAMPKKGKIGNVVWSETDKDSIKKIISEMFDGDFEEKMGTDLDKGLSSLSGLDGMDGEYEVKISEYRDRWNEKPEGTRGVSISISGKNINICTRRILQVPTGSSGDEHDYEDPPYVYNDTLKLSDNTPKGTGTKILASQVSAARKNGLDIKCLAFRDTNAGWVGYAVWPKLGYDANLMTESIEDGSLTDSMGYQEVYDMIEGAVGAGALPEDFLEMADDDELYVSEFMKDQKSRDWWAKNGWSFDAKFDTYEGSQSSDVLDAYVEKKGYTESEDRNPTQEELKELKKALGDKAKDLTPQDLLILFKTLAKQGYFSQEEE